MFIFNENTADVVGTFVCVKFDKKTTALLQEFMNLCEVSNPLDSTEFHATLLYSKEKDLTDLKTSRISLTRMLSKVCGVDEFINKDGSKALVLKLDSNHLLNRHQYLRSKYDVQHTFLEFCPHITLSYNFTGDLAQVNRKLAFFNNAVLVADTEVVEDLKP